MRVCFWGVVGALCAVVVRKAVPEIALSMAILIAVMITALGLTVFQQIFDFTQQLAQVAGLAPELVTPIYKTVGIAIVAKLSSDLCRDADEKAIASAIELLASATGVYVALPLLSAIFGLVQSFLQG